MKKTLVLIILLVVLSLTFCSCEEQGYEGVNFSLFFEYIKFGLKIDKKQINAMREKETTINEKLIFIFLIHFYF